MSFPQSLNNALGRVLKTFPDAAQAIADRRMGASKLWRAARWLGYMERELAKEEQKAIDILLSLRQRLYQEIVELQRSGR